MDEPTDINSGLRIEPYQLRSLPASRAGGVPRGTGAVSLTAPPGGRYLSDRYRDAFALEEELQDEGVTFSDYAKSIMGGFAGLGNIATKGVGWLARQVGSEDLGREIETLGTRAVDYWHDSLSDAAKEELAKSFIVRNEHGEFEWGDAGIQTALLMGAESIPGTLAGAGLGAGLTKVLQVFANPFGRHALWQASKNLAIPGWAESVGPQVAKRAVDASKKLRLVDAALGIAGFGAGEGMVSAPYAAVSVYDEVMRLPQDVLQRNTRYQQVYNTTDGMDEAARHQYAAETVAREAATEAGFQSGLTTALLGAPMGAFFGRVIGKTGRMGSTRLRAALTGFAGESGQEAAQSAAESAISGRAVNERGGEVDILARAINDAVGGAIAGGMLGGVVGGASFQGDAQQAGTGDDSKMTPQRRLMEVGQEALQAGVPLEDIEGVIRQEGVAPLGKVATIRRMTAEAKQRAEAAAQQQPAPPPEETTRSRHEPFRPHVFVPQDEPPDDAGSGGGAAAQYPHTDTRGERYRTLMPGGLVDDAIETVDPFNPERVYPKTPIRNPAADSIEVEQQAHQAAASPLNEQEVPTEGQDRAENYKVGRVEGKRVGLPSMAPAVEYPKGAERHGITMTSHYGRFTGTMGGDGQALDFFMGDTDNDQVFLFHHYDDKGRFTQHKALVNMADLKAAEAELRHFYRGELPGDIVPLSKAEFEKWARENDTTVPHPSAPAREPTIARAPGASQVAITPAGQQIAVQYELRDADELIVSHTPQGEVNPRFPRALQPRDRERAGMRQWVTETVGRFQPALATQGAGVGEGAPVIAPDGVVESGNGRAALLQAVYANPEQAQAYRDYLAQNAAQFGLTADQVGQMNKPVLVRVRTTPMNFEQRRSFAGEANRPSTARYSPAETARNDAGNLSDADLAMFAPSESGNVLAASNQGFLNAFLAKMPAAERAELTTSDGKPTKQLADRVQAAMFAKAYDNEQLTQLAAEEADPDVKTVLASLMRAAPTFAQAKAAGADTEMVVGPLIEAVEVIRNSRTQRQSLDEHLSQQLVPYDADVERMARFIDTHMRSAKRMTEGLAALGEYLEQSALDAATDDMFGAPPPPTLEAAFDRANAAMTEQHGDKAALFSRILKFPNRRWRFDLLGLSDPEAPVAWMDREDFEEAPFAVQFDEGVYKVWRNEGGEQLVVAITDTLEQAQAEAERLAGPAIKQATPLFARRQTRPGDRIRLGTSAAVALENTALVRLSRDGVTAPAGYHLIAQGYDGGATTLQVPVGADAIREMATALDESAAATEDEIDRAALATLATRLRSALQEALATQDDMFGQEGQGTQGQLFEPTAVYETRRGMAGQMDMFTVRRTPKNAAPTPPAGWDQADTSREEPDSSPQQIIESSIGSLRKAGEVATSITDALSAANAAAIIAPFRRQAQENVIVLGLDDAGKPLGLIRHTIGGIASANVELPQLLGALHNMPGVKKVWFAHNHPSGDPGQSLADHSMTRRLISVTSGTGIEVLGGIVVAPDSRSASAYVPARANDADSTFTEMRIRITQQGRKRGRVPVLERQVRRRTPWKGGAVSTTAEAVAALRSMSGDMVTEGIMLMTVRNLPVGWIPMTSAELMQLRTGDQTLGAGKILSQIDALNAQHLIPRVADNRALKNLMNFVTGHGLHVVDGHRPGSTSTIKVTEKLPSGGGTFFSRKGTAPTREQLIEEIPYETAYRAHSGTSFVPERRARQRQEEYANQLLADYQMLQGMVRNDAEQATFDVEWPRYHQNFRQRYLAYLHAHANVMSPMITGPARFPTRRNEKANRSSDNRLSELIELRKKALASIRKKLRPELAPTRAGDEDAAEQWRKKLESREQAQAMMKSVNALIRKKFPKGLAAKWREARGTSDDAVRRREELTTPEDRATLEALATELEGLGLSAKNARLVLTPNYMGAVGFESYQLSNNNAEIRRLKQQIAKATRYQSERAAAGGVQTFEFDRGTVTLDYDENRIRVEIEKSDTETRSQLKAAAFRWSPKNVAWQRQLTDNAKYATGQITGIDFDAAPETAPEAAQQADDEVPEAVLTMPTEEEEQAERPPEAQAEPEPPAEPQWHGLLPDRAGLSAFTHIIRHPGDEDGIEVLGHHAGSGRDPTAWKQDLKGTPDEWAGRIARLLADGRPRSFNRIVLELTGGKHHADAAYTAAPDKGLWLAVEQGRVQWRNGEHGVEFGIVEGAATDPAAELEPPPETPPPAAAPAPEPEPEPEAPAAQPRSQMRLFSRNQTQTPEFRAWFGDSKVVDENGEPLRVHHGTDRSFDSFSKRKAKGDSLFRWGFFFAENPATSSIYAMGGPQRRAVQAMKDRDRPGIMNKLRALVDRLRPEGAPAPQNMPVYLSIQNPLVLDVNRGNWPYVTRDYLRKNGHDGVKILNADGSAHWVALEPTQIKSAIGNRGTFDARNPSILMSRGAGNPTPRAPWMREQLAGMDLTRFERLGVKVRFVQTPDQIPGGVPADVEGAYFQDGTVYFVEANLTAENFREKFDHEVWGHAAIERDPAFEPVIRQVRNAINVGNKEIMGLVAEVQARQGMLPKDVEAREVLALMAERGGSKSSVWQRFTDAASAFASQTGLRDPASLTQEQLRRTLRTAARNLERDSRIARDFAAAAAGSEAVRTLQDRQDPTDAEIIAGLRELDRQYRSQGLYQVAYQGTGRDEPIKRHNRQYWLTGEGTANQGAGHYFTSKKEVGEWYRKTLTLDGGARFTVRVNGGEPYVVTLEELDPEEYSDFLAAVRIHNQTEPNERQRLIDSKVVALEFPIEETRKALRMPMSEERARNLRYRLRVDERRLASFQELIAPGTTVEQKESGRVYQVDVPEDDDLLHWDKALKSQPPRITDWLKRTVAPWSGESLYDEARARNLNKRNNITIKKLPAGGYGLEYRGLSMLSIEGQEGQYAFSAHPSDQGLEFGFATMDQALTFAEQNAEKISRRPPFLPFGNDLYEMIVAWRMGKDPREQNIDRNDFEEPEAQAASVWLAENGIPGHVYTSGSGNKNYVIFDDDAIQITGMFSRDQRNALGFYSGLSRAAQGLKQERGTPAQMLAMLKKQPGVKDEEIEWTGLEQFLEQAGDRVTKQQLVDYLDQRGVTVREELLAGTEEDHDLYDPELRWGEFTVQHDGERMATVVDEKSGIEFSVYVDDDAGNVAVRREQHADFGFAEWLDIDMPVNRQSQSDAEDAIIAFLVNSFPPQAQGAFGPPEYEEFSSKGGRNYQERVLTLQLPQYGVDELTELPADVKVYFDSNEQPDRAWRVVSAMAERFPVPYYGVGEASPEEAIERYLAEENAKREGDVRRLNRYRSNHWPSIDNPIVHMRTKVYDTADGETVLFIEEIQSDWHQQGRKEGYIAPRKPRPRFEVRQRETDWVAVSKDTGEVLRHNGNEIKVSRGALDVDRESDAYEFLNRLQASWHRDQMDGGILKVPEAPFKSTWHELAIKRILTLAAEQGVDRVAWTPGMMQVERYDLSKRISRVVYQDAQSGGIADARLDEPERGGVLKVFDHDGEKLKELYVEHAELPDFIGEELAQKLLAAPPEKRRQAGIGVRHRELAGQDVKIGGEGMMYFYDQIVPKAFRKMAQKLDKAAGKIETVRLPGGQLRQIDPEDVYAAETTTAPLAAASVRITPKMRETAMSVGQPLFSRAATMPAGVDPAVEEISRRTMAPAPEDLSIMDRARQLVGTLIGIDKDEVVQGVIDDANAIKLLERQQYGELLDASQSAYKATLATRNLASVMVPVMTRGSLTYRDGSFQIQPGTKGVVEIFSRLTDHADGNLLHLWENYASARRAADLRAAGRPHQPYSSSDIDTLLALEQQYPEFREVLDDWTEFNNAHLDLLVKQGVLDADMVEVWKQNVYAPWYRILPDAETELQGPFKHQSLSGHGGQRIKQRLKAQSDLPIGNVFENMMMNTAYMIDEAFKNEAMRRIVNLGEGVVLNRIDLPWEAVNISNSQIASALKKQGIAVGNLVGGELGKLSAEQRAGWTKLFRRYAPTGPNVVSYYEGGKPVYYEVHDPLLLRSINAMGVHNVNGLLDTLFHGSKRLLTGAVTLDPAFMAANLMRDTLSTFVIAGQPGMKPVIDALKGAKAAFQQGDEIMEIMAAGGGGGGYYDTQPADLRKFLVQHLGSQSKAKRFENSIVHPKGLFQFWRRISSSAENANRVAVYRAVRKNGGSVAEAAYQARDVLNFTMRGDYAAVRWLTMSVPFMNARIQGLYRLARGAKSDPRGFMIRGSMILAATAALMLRNDDREEYEELPEWDRDTYWHIFLNPRGTPVGEGDHWRIPKPFEAGIIFGTAPERMFRLAAGRDTAAIAMERAMDALGETLAMNPIPQLAKPLVEQFANRSFFTDRPIVGYREQYLPAEAQYGPWTSETARAAAELMPDWAPEGARSPQRLEHLVRSYLGATGMYVLGTSDIMARKVGPYPERPAPLLSERPVLRRFLQSAEPRSTKYADQLYDLLNEADGIFRAINTYREQNRLEEAQRLAQENRSLLAIRRPLRQIAQQATELNNQQRRILASDLSAQEKREQILQLQRMRNEAFARVTRYADL